MKRLLTTVLAALLAWGPASLAAQQGAPESRSSFTSGMPNFTKGVGHMPNFVRPFSPWSVPQADMANSPRVEQLLREGKITLSLSDAIALAIENNLDVAIQRYNPLISDTDILRAQAGSGARGLRAAVTSGSNVGVAGAQGSASALTGGGGAAASGGSLSGSFDPVITSTLSIGHTAQPVTSFVTRQVQGINAVKAASGSANFAFQQAFHTGTRMNFSWNNSRSTNVLNTLNPQISTNYSLQLSQPLLNGWGLAQNRRSIYVAKNNREVSDLVFKQQIIQTVSAVQNVYWDLVSATEDVKVRERSLQVAEKLYNDNKRQVEIGTLAPIEVVRAEAEVAARRQDLIVSQSNQAQLTTSIKNLILRNVSDSAIQTAAMVPTERISVPPVEAVIPIQELMSQALSARPELAQSRIDMTNRDINIRSTKNLLLPSVDAFATYGGRGVAGATRSGLAPVTELEGGLGRSLSQTFGGDYPDYAFGLQLSIPLRNRAAQADAAQALLDRRQADLRVRQLENQVRVEVQNAMIALQSNRARIDAAQKQRELAEKSLDAEQKKFQLGASTNFQVIQAQRDLTAALSAEVAALNNYMKSKVELDRATGQTTTKNSIVLEDAYQGRLTRNPSATPLSKQD